MNLTATASVASLLLLLSAPAKAATFSFLYQFLSGESLSGTIEGELQADNNTVSNLTNLSATYSGTGEVYSGSDLTGQTLKLNGNNLYFEFDNPAPSYFAFSNSNGKWAALQSGSVQEYEPTFNTSAWTMTLQATPNPNPNVPEPSLLGGLAFFGLMLHTLKRVNR